MKVLITSDTHGRYSVLEKIASLHKDKDLHIDAGDLLLTQKELESLKLTAVKGNTDHFLELPLQQIVTIDDKKWLIVHGQRSKCEVWIRKTCIVCQYITSRIMWFMAILMSLNSSRLTGLLILIQAQYPILDRNMRYMKTVKLH